MLIFKLNYHISGKLFYRTIKSFQDRCGNSCFLKTNNCYTGIRCGSLQVPVLLIKVVRDIFLLDHTWHFGLAFYQPFPDLIDVKFTPLFEKGLKFG